MYNKEIKAGLAFLSLAYAVYQFIEVEIGNGIFFTLLAGLFVLFIFRHERILLAFVQLRKQDFEKAEKHLLKIKHPDRLVKSQRAYYYYLMGLLSSQSKSLGKSEKFFKKALNIGLRMSHDQAMAKLNLAGIAAAKRKKREAITLLNQAKKLDSKGMLDDQIKMMRSQLGRI